MPNRAAFLILGLLFAGCAVRVASVWDQLPPMLASHFDASGTPNAWTERGLFFALYTGILGGTVLLLVACSVWIDRIPPRLINLPHRDYWSTPERLPIARARIARWMAWGAVGTALFSVVVLELTIRANLERVPLDSRALGLALAAYFAGAIVGTVWLWRGLRPNGK